MRTFIYMLCLIIMICFYPYSTASASGEGEKVKIGFFPLKGFYQYDNNGNPEGYGVECAKHIAAQAGWNYEFVKADNWNDAIEML